MSGRERVALAAAVVGVVAVWVLTTVIELTTGSSRHGFLNWNLFLAWLPLVFAAAMLVVARRVPPLMIVPGVLWLLFFPNAPYVLTDVIHLGATGSRVPPLLDMGTILLAAATGLLCGLISLLWVERALGLEHHRLALVARVLVMLATSIGVWLGRVPRWNSWDALQQPGELLLLISGRVLHPWDHPLMWFSVGAFTGFLLLAYGWFRRLLAVSG